MLIDFFLLLYLIIYILENSDHFNIRLRIIKNTSHSVHGLLLRPYALCSSRSKANIQQKQQTHFLLFSFSHYFEDAAMLHRYWAICFVSFIYLYMYTEQRGWADVSTLRQQTLFSAERWKGDSPSMYSTLRIHFFIVSFLFLHWKCFRSAPLFFSCRICPEQAYPLFKVRSRLHRKKNRNIWD